jgi:hypothetical protein
LVLVVGALVGFILFGSLDGGNVPARVADSPSVLDTELPPPPTVAIPTPDGPTSEVSPSEPSTPTPRPQLATVSPTPTTETSSPVPTPTPSAPQSSPPPTPAAAPVFYKNCPAVRRAGLLGLLRGMPGYSLRLDPDGDGVACDRRG